MGNITKPYQLNFDLRPHYLYARVTADEMDVPTAIEYMTAVIAKCRELKAKRLLIEHIVGVGLSINDTFEVTKAVASMPVSGIKIAFVDADPEYYENYRFGELVGDNRGIWGRVCTTVPDAESWLLENIPLDGPPLLGVFSFLCISYLLYSLFDDAFLI